MEYLVTMTTHVPDGTPAEAVDDVRARAAAGHASSRRRGTCCGTSLDGAANMAHR